VIEQEFLKYSADKLSQLRGRIHDCLGRLTTDQVWLRHAENENSIGNLILHLSGNVRQWIGHGIAGQANIRDRDAEFAAHGGLDKEALLLRLDEAINAAIATIETLSPERLPDHVTIQNYDVTILEAIYHVVEHFAGHTGQIIFATKLLTQEDLGYNRHLSQPKHKETTPKARVAHALLRAASPLMATLIERSGTPISAM
jgi:uncharacterized damage-inducible protein DinB